MCIGEKSFELTMILSRYTVASQKYDAKKIQEDKKKCVKILVLESLFEACVEKRKRIFLYDEMQIFGILTNTSESFSK